MQNVTIANTTDKRRVIDLFVRDVRDVHSKKVTGAAYATFAPGTTQHGAGRWIQLEQRTLTLAPGAKQVVSVRIDVPSTAPPGSGLAALMIHVRPLDDGAVALSTDITLLMLLAIDAQKLPQKLELSITPVHRMVWNDKLAWNVNVTNPSALHRTVAAEVQVSGAGNRRTIRLRPMIIFPNSSRSVPVTLTSSGRPGLIDATIRMRVAGTPSSDRVASAPRVVLIPWWFAVLTGLLLGIIIWRLFALTSRENDDGSDGLF